MGKTSPKSLSDPMDFEFMKERKPLFYAGLATPAQPLATSRRLSEIPAHKWWRW